MRAVITGAGHYAPEHRLTNADLEKMVNTSDEWITTRTGIKERRILDSGLGTSYMAAEAARMILDAKQMDAAAIDLIITATVTPDMMVPSAAALVQKSINAENCWGFDINGGCTGFLCALATGSQFIETGRHQKVLVIGADKMSAIIDYQDRNTCVIFGDAAGAVLLEPSDDPDAGIRDFELHLDGSGSRFLHIPAGGSLCPASEETVQKRMHYVHQDGKAVFKRAVNDMAEVSLSIMKRNHISGRDVSLLIPHQANCRIIDAVSRKMGLSANQVIINIERYGNTTAATIPLALSEAVLENRIQKGDNIMMSAFGAGFTWGSALIRWG